jgi:ssDNA-binding Zn-finger/Zn-ribbon topoisomerase 1
MEISGGVNVTAIRKGRLDMQTKQNPQEHDLLSLMSQNEKDASVSLPYNGSSGWSGTDTSRERATTSDTTGETSKRQRETIRALMSRGEDGMTWKELADYMGWHHGTASGALSVLHKDGRIARLISKRDKCRIYVANNYINGRETDSQGRKPKECPNCGHHL